MKSYIVVRVYPDNREEILYYIDVEEEKLISFLRDEMVKIVNFDKPYDIYNERDVQVKQVGNITYLELGKVKYKAIKKFILI